MRAGLAVAAAEHALGRVDLAVGGDHQRDRVAARSVDDFGPRRAAAATGAAGARPQALALDQDRVLDLDQLDALAVDHAGARRDPVGHPAVGLRAGRPAVDVERELVDERLAAVAEIGPGHHRAHARAAMSEPVAVAEGREGGLDDVDQAIGDVGGGERAGVGGIPVSPTAEPLRSLMRMRRNERRCAGYRARGR